MRLILVLLFFVPFIPLTALMSGAHSVTPFIFGFGLLVIGLQFLIERRQRAA